MIDIFGTETYYVCLSLGWPTQIIRNKCTENTYSLSYSFNSESYVFSKDYCLLECDVM
jgi:hypothetical protein